MKIKENYTLPKLCNRKNDLKKDWFVYFYYTDNVSGVKKIFRYKLGINYYKTKKERESEAEAIKYNLLDRLKSGWNPISNETDKSECDLTIIDAVTKAIELKSKTLTKNSIRTYSNAFNIFKKFINKKGCNNLYAHNVTPETMQSYFDYLLADRNYTGVSHNNHLNIMGSIFSVMEERKMIHVNPCIGIKKAKEEKGKNTVYSAYEENKFKEYITCKNFGFYLATRFVKYCFLRRSELHGLQVRHIHWESKTIVIPSSSAKSRFQDSVTVPKTLESIIEKSGILELHPDTYIFSAGFKPGTDAVKKDDLFTNKQKEINEKLGISENCSFYSWKHTGAVELYNKTKDPYAIMRQCRHQDIKTTMRYLRALGCGVNESVRAW